MEEQEQEGRKVIRINVLQTSMTLGTYLGAYISLAWLVTALTVRYNALSFMAMPLMAGIPVVAWFLIRRFRDSTKVPFFPFPISWMLSILTFLFATVLSCMAAYLYLRFIDRGALAGGLMEMMDLMMQSSQTATQSMTDTVQIERYNQTLELMQQSISWFCSLPASGMTKQLIRSSLMWGNILSLIIGLITAKRIRFN